MFDAHCDQGDPRDLFNVVAPFGKELAFDELAGVRGALPKHLFSLLANAILDRLSLDAAAQVLRERAQAMTTKALIGVMALKGYWTSPNGQTPHATLYAAIAREIATQGDASRFVKSAPGRFTLRPSA